MTKVNLHINRQTLEIREVARDCSIMHEISMWGITTGHHTASASMASHPRAERGAWIPAHPCRQVVILRKANNLFDLAKHFMAI